MRIACLLSILDSFGMEWIELQSARLVRTPLMKINDAIMALKSEMTGQRHWVPGRLKDLKFCQHILDAFFFGDSRCVTYLMMIRCDVMRFSFKSVSCMLGMPTSFYSSLFKREAFSGFLPGSINYVCHCFVRFFIGQVFTWLTSNPCQPLPNIYILLTR